MDERYTPVRIPSGMNTHMSFTDHNIKNPAREQVIKKVYVFWFGTIREALHTAMQQQRERNQK